MHVAEKGRGPLVVSCHGFPESWYSWRHQLRALADAGFRQWRPTSRSLAMGRTVLTTRCREARGSYHGLPTRLHSRAGSVKETSTSMQESSSGQGSVAGLTITGM